MSADPRVADARAYAATTRPRHDVLLPASVLTRMFYECRRHVLALLELIDADAEPARDPDLERWLTRQLEHARSQPAGPEDLAAVRKLAAMEGGTVAEAVARWLREVREAGQ